MDKDTSSINKKMLKVGGCIVDFAQVYKIIKIGSKKTSTGKEREVIFFRPYYRNEHNRSLVCSIPMNNLSKTTIRRPLSVQELKKLFIILGNKPEAEESSNFRQVKDTISLNDPFIIARTLKNLWGDNSTAFTNFSLNRKASLQLLLSGLEEEVAFVLDFSLEQARKKIRKALQKEHTTKNILLARKVTM